MRIQNPVENAVQDGLTRRPRLENSADHPGYRGDENNLNGNTMTDKMMHISSRPIY